MDSGYAGSDTHMRSHMFGNDSNSQANNQNYAGSIFAALIGYALIKLFKNWNDKRKSGQ